MHNLLEMPNERVGGREGRPPVFLHKTITGQDEGSGTRLTLRSRFDRRELRDENVRSYGSVQGARDLFQRLTNFLAERGVAA